MQKKNNQASDKLMSSFEDSLHAQVVSFQRVNFSDIVISEQEFIRHLVCYVCLKIYLCY